MKEYEAYLKDQSEFTIVDQEVSEILEKVVYFTPAVAGTNVIPSVVINTED